MSNTLWSHKPTRKLRLLTPTQTLNVEVTPPEKNRGVIGCLSIVPDGP